MGNRGNDSKRRALRRKLEQKENCCWLCGFALVPDAEPFTDFATEIDEELPASKGGDVYGVVTPCHLTHRCCNLKKSDKVMNQYELAEWFEANHMHRDSYSPASLPSFWR